MTGIRWVEPGTVPCHLVYPLDLVQSVPTGVALEKGPGWPSGRGPTSLQCCGWELIVQAASWGAPAPGLALFQSCGVGSDTWGSAITPANLSPQAGANQASSFPPKSFKLLGILDAENTCMGFSTRRLVRICCAWPWTFFCCCCWLAEIDDHVIFGVGGFILLTLGCWFHCRYNYAKQRIHERIAREGIKNKILDESAHLGTERKQTNSNSSSWESLSLEKQNTTPWNECEQQGEMFCVQ